MALSRARNTHAPQGTKRRESRALFTSSESRRVVVHEDVVRGLHLLREISANEAVNGSANTSRLGDRGSRLRRRASTRTTRDQRFLRSRLNRWGNSRHRKRSRGLSSRLATTLALSLGLSLGLRLGLVVSLEGLPERGSPGSKDLANS